MKSSPAGNNGVPISLAIRDTPPNGVAILFFEASITAGACNQAMPRKRPPAS